MKDLLLEILKKEVKPAMGCTEPIAVAYAAAKAKQVLGGNTFEKMVVEVSPNFYKNGLAVGIPHTNFVGLDIAAIVGFLDGNADAGLEVLKGVSDENTKEADEFLDQVQLKIADTDESVYVKVYLTSGTDSSEVIIEGSHDQITSIKKNDVIISTKEDALTILESLDLTDFYKLDVIDIINEVEKIPEKELLFMLDGYEMNKAIATVGLKKKYGLGFGYSIHQMIDEGFLGDNLVNQAAALTAAASDARMAGVNMPVMSSNGSGNNGITAIIPIVAYAETHDVSKGNIAKAIAMSHLINNYIKKEIGRLSAMCSCSVSAGSSVSAALVWLMGGSRVAISGAIKNMIGNVSGMICDGAKGGCALKLSTASNLAVFNAKLSLMDSVVGHKNGIVHDSLEQSIKNLGVLSRKGMKLTDQVILDIMMSHA